MALLFCGEHCQSLWIYIPEFLDAELVPIIILCPASIPLVGVHGREIVYFVELPSDIDA